MGKPLMLIQVLDHGKNVAGANAAKTSIEALGQFDVVVLVSDKDTGMYPLVGVHRADMN